MAAERADISDGSNAVSLQQFVLEAVRGRLRFCFDKHYMSLLFAGDVLFCEEPKMSNDVPPEFDGDPAKFKEWRLRVTYWSVATKLDKKQMDDGASRCRLVLR